MGSLREQMKRKGRIKFHGLLDFFYYDFTINTRSEYKKLNIVAVRVGIFNTIVLPSQLKKKKRKIPSQKYSWISHHGSVANESY